MNRVGVSIPKSRRAPDIPTPKGGGFITPKTLRRWDPQEWVTLSLSIYAKRDVRYPGHTRFALHIPLEKYVATPKKAKDQLKENPSMPVVTVDLGVNRLAVMGAFLESRLMATKSIKCAVKPPPLGVGISGARRQATLWY